MARIGVLQLVVTAAGNYMAYAHYVPNSASPLFAYHPLLMTIGLVLACNAIFIQVRCCGMVPVLVHGTGGG